MKKPPPEIADAVRAAKKAYDEGRPEAIVLLDKMIDTVLAYHPKPKTKASKRRKRKAQRDAKKG